MSTRGFVGFVVDGAEKIAYNHSDSYPEELGARVLGWLTANRHAITCDLHKGTSGEPVDLARALRVASPDSEPTDEDIERLSRYRDAGVGERRERPEWYQLLRHTQGNPSAMLAAGVIEDASSFPLDSLYAEWGYIVDFDAGTFEVYRGFQDAPHNQGRFAMREGGERSNGYRPCALVQTWHLAELPNDREFLAALGGNDA